MNDNDICCKLKVWACIEHQKGEKRKGNLLETAIEIIDYQKAENETLRIEKNNLIKAYRESMVDGLKEFVNDFDRTLYLTERHYESNGKTEGVDACKLIHTKLQNALKEIIGEEV